MISSRIELPQFDEFCQRVTTLLGKGPLDITWLEEVWIGADQDFTRAINHAMDTPSHLVREAQGGAQVHSSPRKKSKKKKRRESPDSYDLASPRPDAPVFPVSQEQPSSLYTQNFVGLAGPQNSYAYPAAFGMGMPPPGYASGPPGSSSPFLNSPSQMRAPPSNPGQWAGNPMYPVGPQNGAPRLEATFDQAQHSITAHIHQLYKQAVNLQHVWNVLEDTKYYRTRPPLDFAPDGYQLPPQNYPSPVHANHGAPYDTHAPALNESAVGNFSRASNYQTSLPFPEVEKETAGQGRCGHVYAHVEDEDDEIWWE